MSINNEFWYSQVGLQRQRELLEQARQDRLANEFSAGRVSWWRRLVSHRSAPAPTKLEVPTASRIDETSVTKRAA